MGIIMKNKVCYSNGGDTTIQPVIYSDTEREVGVWRDGKPLYQKTIFYVGGQYGNITFNHGIANIDKVVKAEGAATDTEIQDNTYQLIPRSDSNGNIIMVSQVNKTELTYAVSQAFGARVVDIYFTVWYTKTTDTPGSGIWTPSGVPAVHYSTDEQVIGTWIDGKTLYQKTIDCGNLPNSTTKNVPHLISGITPSDIVDISGVGQYAGHYTTPLPKVHDGSINSQVMIEVDDTNIILYSRNGNNASYVGYITLRYTKTTS